MPVSKKIAVYPGSFDPPTNGHLDIIKRAAAVFDLVIVGILDNSSKTPLFSSSERVKLVKTITKDIKNVKVDSFSGLLVDFMKEVGASVIIKGLRNVSDYEYEFQMALLNQKLNPKYETLFLMTNSKYSYLSSSMIKELARLKGGLDELVPNDIIDVIKSKF